MMLINNLCRMTEIDVFDISNSEESMVDVGRGDQDTPTTSGSANTSSSGVASNEEEEGDLWCLTRSFNQADLGEASEVADQGVANSQEAKAESLPEEDEPMKLTERVPGATGDQELLERDSNSSNLEQRRMALERNFLR